MSFYTEQALIRAAEKIAKRTLTQQERDRLLQLYRAAEGTERKRAEEALRKLFGWTESEYEFRASKSDDTGTAIGDLVADITRPRR